MTSHESPPRYFKGYYMITSRCNLDCSYCVLEDSLDQLRRELSLTEKQALITHLYQRLGFRSLTLSGGEPLLIGSQPPADFLRLMDFLRQFKSQSASANMRIELYSNLTYLSEPVAEAMQGVVDLVAVTVDSIRDDLLTEIGRNSGRFKSYLSQVERGCALLASRGLPIKLHTVVSQRNARTISSEVSQILARVQNTGVLVTDWKFYQYMSYDGPCRDMAHSIGSGTFDAVSSAIRLQLPLLSPRLRFKSNDEMNQSIFNILPYGNAQFMRPGQSWSNTARTRDLRSYHSIWELLEEVGVCPQRFAQFHEIRG